ncbi:general stress protein [Bacillus sp. NPDC060175]|uniref:general stress protein n=1 Tax=Bacillus sp. NPDC060175 TaxID=3347061 RepID=UPI00365D9E15
MKKIFGTILGLTLSAALSVGLAFSSQSDSKKQVDSTKSSTIMYMQSSHGDSW